MFKIVASFLAVMVVVGFAGRADAINMDATFDAGTLPSDFGWNPGGGVDPSTNVADGVWTNNLVAGESSVWSGGAAAAGTVTGPVIHGWSEIQVVDFGTGTNDDKSVFGLFRHTELVGVGNEHGFLSYFNNGEYRVLSSGFSQGIPVANTDGAFHKYGWQVDESTRNLKLFFDDVQIASGTMTGNFAGESGTYFGDGSGGGNHHEIWTRVVVAEGAYPGAPPPPPTGVIFDGTGNPTAAGFDFISNIPADDANNPMGWDFDTENPAGTGPIAQPGTLYQDTTPFSGTSVSASQYQLPFTTASAEFQRTEGWFVEFNTESLQNTGDRFGNFLAVGDDAGGIGVLLNPDSYEFYEGDFNGYPATPDLDVALDAGYHTVRLTMTPGGTLVDVLIDGLSVGSVPTNTANNPRLVFGDGSSNSAGQANWDYIVVNAEIGLDGDLNDDGFVGQDDLNLVLASWGQTVDADDPADFNDDLFIGQDDLNPVLADWGQGTPPGELSAVPEPHALLLLGLGVIAAVPLLRNRRRRK